MGPKRQLSTRAGSKAVGIEPATCSGTRESSERAGTRAREVGRVPARPGDLVRGSPSESTTTRSLVQSTPVKAQGSAVKSQEAKKWVPGASAATWDRRCARARPRPSQLRVSARRGSTWRRGTIAKRRGAI